MHSHPRRRHGLLATLLLAGLVLRLYWVLVFPSLPYADSVWYYEQARNLAQGEGYRYHGAPTAIWPVGYPFFLSLVFRLSGPSLLSAKITNVLLLTLDLLLIFVFAGLASKDSKVAFLTSLIVIFSPSHIVASGLVVTEPLFACLVHGSLIVLLLAVERKNAILWVLQGVLVGLVAYVRPEGSVLLVVVLLCCHKTLRPLRTVRGILLPLMIVLSSILVLAPWAIRNWAQLGMFIPVSTTGCMNLWVGSSPMADGGFFAPPDPSVNPTILRENDTEQTWYTRSCQAAFRLIADDPLRVIWLWPRKIFKLWKDDHDLVYWNVVKTSWPVSQQQADRVSALADTYYIAALALGIAGLCQWFAQRLVYSRDESRSASGYWVSVVVIACFTLVYLPFFGNSRFRFALFPLVALFAARLLASRLPVGRLSADGILVML